MARQHGKSRRREAVENRGTDVTVGALSSAILVGGLIPAGCPLTVIAAPDE
jgi:hypothetical protein